MTIPDARRDEILAICQAAGSADPRRRPVRSAGLRRRSDPGVPVPRPRRRHLRQHVLQDVRARAAGRLDPGAARGPREARHHLRGTDPVPERVRTGGHLDVLRDDAVAGAAQDVPGGRTASGGTRPWRRSTDLMPAGTRWTVPRRRLLHLGHAAGRPALQGDAAAGDRRAGRVRARHRLLRRRHRRRPTSGCRIASRRRSASVRACDGSLL